MPFILHWFYAIIQTISPPVKRDFMSVLKRLLPYILLNILVSAATTYGVLMWWNNNNTPNVPGLSQPSPAAPMATMSASSLLPLGVPVIEIGEVVGAGSLNSEGVLLRRVGDGELRLNGWRLEDNAGHRFTFPDIVLFKGGSVRVFSRAGSNTVNELYWGLDRSVWTSGRSVVLYDDQGNSRATAPVP
jgi:hypothetical protein